MKATATVPALVVVFLALMGCSDVLRPPPRLSRPTAWEKVLCVAFADQGKSLIVGTSFGTVKTYGRTSGEGRSCQLQGLNHQVDAMALSSDGEKLAAWDRSGTISVWNLPSCQRHGILQEHAGKGKCLGFSPDNQTLAGGGASGIMLWDVATSRLKSSWAVSGYWVSCLAFTPDGRTLAYGIREDSRNNPIKLWDMQASKERKTLARDSSATYSLAFSPDGETLVCGTQLGGPVELWDMGSAKQLSPLQGHSHNAVVVAFAPDGKTLASGSMDGTAIAWEWKTKKVRLRFKVSSYQTDSPLAFSPDSRTLAVFDPDDWLILWDVQTGQEQGRIKP
jgi:WD40 repeat protein